LIKFIDLKILNLRNQDPEKFENGYLRNDRNLLSSKCKKKSQSRKYTKEEMYDELISKYERSIQYERVETHSICKKSVKNSFSLENSKNDKKVGISHFSCSNVSKSRINMVKRTNKVRKLHEDKIMTNTSTEKSHIKRKSIRISSFNPVKQKSYNLFIKSDKHLESN